MRLIPITRAVGLTLARDLPPPRRGQMPLLRVGATITERYQRAIADHGIHAVWVHDELSERVEPAELIPEPLRREAAKSVAFALASAREAFARAQPLSAAAIIDLQGVVDRLVANLVSSPNATLALSDQASADPYTHRHSVNVCALGLLLGRELFRRNGWRDWNGRRRHDRVEEMLSKLGLGLLLHDIGKMIVPAEVLNKPGALTDAEWELMRAHPEAGAALLGFDRVGPLVISVVHDHHERWDGSGYPGGLAGEQITQFARLAAVADVYDAICSGRPYKQAAPAHVGVRIIAEGSGRGFDPEVVAIFRRLVFPYPVGSELRLPDGRVGVVSAVDPASPDTPTVRVAAASGPIELRVDTRGQASGAADEDL